MGYQIVDPAGLEPMENRPCVAYSISDSAGLQNMGLRRYHCEPGEQIPLNYHSHREQEETFYVLEGTLVVETPDREYTVPAGQCFVVDPGSPHRSYNSDDASDTLSVLAMGAPAVDDIDGYEPE